MNAYSKTYRIRFSDIDANRHVNDAVFIEAAGEVRYEFFTEHGYPPARFEQLGISPVYTNLNVQFLREVLMGETVTITFLLSGLSPQGIYWKTHHDVLKANGKKAVSLDGEGAVFDLATRKPVAPTEELQRIFGLIPRAEAFESLPEVRRMR